jgi:hypothetical protein
VVGQVMGWQRRRSRKAGRPPVFRAGNPCCRQRWRTMRDTANQVSKESVDLVRRLYAELSSEGSTREVEQRLIDDTLSRFLDTGVEWVPVPDSLLAVDSYRGFEGVRRFWGEFLSTWESYRVEPPRTASARRHVRLHASVPLGHRGVGRIGAGVRHRAARRMLRGPRWRSSRPRSLRRSSTT